METFPNADSTHIPDLSTSINFQRTKNLVEKLSGKTHTNFGSFQSQSPPRPLAKLEETAKPKQTVTEESQNQSSDDKTTLDSYIARALKD